MKCSYCNLEKDKLKQVGRYMICDECISKAESGCCPTCGATVEPKDMVKYECIECAQLRSVEDERINQEEMMGIFQEHEWHIGEHQNITWEDLIAQSQSSNEFLRVKKFKG